MEGGSIKPEHESQEQRLTGSSCAGFMTIALRRDVACKRHRRVGPASEAKSRPGASGFPIDGAPSGRHCGIFASIHIFAEGCTRGGEHWKSTIATQPIGLERATHSSVLDSGMGSPVSPQVISLRLAGGRQVSRDPSHAALRRMPMREPAPLGGGSSRCLAKMA